jgi:hypothetical protein
MKFTNILTSPIRYIKDRFFKEYPNEYEDLSNNSGKVIEKDGQKIAIYKDSEGKIFELSPYCTHLGCVVEWNDKEKRWDCPCHGSYFTKDGKVQKGPANSDLEFIDNLENSYHIVKILEIEQLTHDVKRFKVEKPKGYTFIPGQATEVAINMEDYRNKFHPFTFTSLNEDSYLEFIIKGYPTNKYPDHSGVTEQIHKLKEGDEFLIKEPVGTIKYKGKGVFLAGGAGITPFIAIFKDLQKKNELSHNSLIFSNRKQQDVIMENNLKDMFNKNNLILVLTKEKIEGYEYGRIDKKFLEKNINNFDQYFYICGPSTFEEDITNSLISLGADKEKIVIEEW